MFILEQQAKYEVKGYRTLTQEEMDLFNENKELADKVGSFIARLKENSCCEKHWLEVGQLDLQKGFMCIGRAIARFC